MIFQMRINFFFSAFYKMNNSNSISPEINNFMQTYSNHFDSGYFLTGYGCWYISLEQSGKNIATDVAQ